MTLVDVYGLIGWAAIILMAALYLTASRGRLPAIGTATYFALGITAFAMVMLRFAEAF
ncbi:MAG: hypothetical protein AAF962_24515 [Actinomycetota bacterium]